MFEFEVVPYQRDDDDGRDERDYQGWLTIMLLTVQMSLSIPQTAVDGLIQVFPLVGFGIAATIERHTRESY